MATIGASLRLYDQITDTLTRAEQGVQSLITAAERLNAVAQQPVEIRVDTGQADTQIDAMATRIASLAGTGQIQVNVGVADISQQIGQLQQQLRFALADATVRVTVDADTVLQDAAQLKSSFESVLTLAPVAVQLDASRVQGDLSALLSQLSNSTVAVTIPIHLDTAQALEQLMPLKQQLSSQVVPIPLDVVASLDHSRIPDELAALRARISGFTATLALTVEVDTEHVLGKLGALKQQLTTQLGAIPVPLVAELDQASLQRVTTTVDGVRTTAAGPIILHTDTATAIAQIDALGARIAFVTSSADIQVTVGVADIVSMNDKVAQLAGRLQAAIAEKKELAKQMPDGAANGLNSAIEKMRSNLQDTVGEQKQLNDAMQRGDLSSVNDAYHRLNRKINDVQGSIRDNTTVQGEFNKAVDEGTNALSSMAKKAIAVVSAYSGIKALFGFFRSAKNEASGMIAVEQRLQTIMGNINGMTQDGIELVKERARELEATTAISAVVGIAGQSQLAEYVYDPTNITGMTEAMYNLATETYGANVSAEQLQQTANLMGKVMMGDINALSRNGFKIDAIFTKAEQKLLKTGTEAERAAMVVEMIEENLSGLAEAMGNTPDGQVIKFGNAWAGVKEKIGYGVLPMLGQLGSYITEKMPTIEAVLIKVFGNLIRFIQTVLQRAMAVAEFFINNWSKIQPVLYGLSVAIGGVVAGLVVFNAVTAITNTLQAISAARAALATGMSIAQAAATRTATGAQVGLNAAMLANPITWIVIGVIALIAAIVVLVRYLMNLWKTNDEFAAGLMRAWNTILKFFDQVPIFFVGVWNGIVNGAYDMKVATLKILEDLVNGSIDKINSFIEKLNKLPWIQLEAVQNVSFAAEAAAEAEAIRQAGEERLNRMQEDAAEKAAKREKDVVDKILEREKERAKLAEQEKRNDDMFKSPGIPGGKMATGVWDVGDGRLPNIEKVKEVGKIKDKVDISSEDLKTMRDLAEMNAIQNFVTLTPTVNITTGDIRNGVDLDTMIDKINEELLKEIEANSKGVYDSGG